MFLQVFPVYLYMCVYALAIPMITFSDLIECRNDRAVCRFVKHIISLVLVEHVLFLELRVLVIEMVLMRELVCVSLIPSVVLRQRSNFFFFFSPILGKGLEE